MFSLAFIGSFVERIIGRKRFFWFYIIAGVFAGIVFVSLAGFFGTGFGEKIFGNSGLERVEIVSWDYFPFIAAERTFHWADYFHNIFSRAPLLKYLPAVYVIGGYKK